VVVIPSVAFEGVPNVLLEAMMAGCPVVATTVGGIPEVVTDEGEALLVPPGDDVALAKAVARVLRDVGLREHLIKAARERVRSRHSAASRARRFMPSRCHHGADARSISCRLCTLGRGGSEGLARDIPLGVTGIASSHRVSSRRGRSRTAATWPVESTSARLRTRLALMIRLLGLFRRERVKPCLCTTSTSVCGHGGAPRAPRSSVEHEHFSLIRRETAAC
jgi:hypothetical protein